MTIGEINLSIKNYKKLQDVRNREIYNLASLTAAFVGCSFAGKKVPDFEQVFQSSVVEAEQNNGGKQGRINMRTKLDIEMFKAFADGRNKQLDKQIKEESNK